MPTACRQEIDTGMFVGYIQGVFYTYFALDDGNNTNHRMYVISCIDADPMTGKWTPEHRLYVSGADYFAIDGTVLQYGTGALYFLYSGWPAVDSGFPQNLYIARMLDPITIGGSRVLLREPTLSWETNGDPVIEGPQVLQHAGRTFVIYSASGSWTPDYCLGMIGIDNLAEPMEPSNWWQDVNHPVFWRNDAEGVYGPGHASFTISPDGSQVWIMYHATQNPAGGWDGRTARTQIYGLNPDNSPAFPRPAGLSVSLATPSGQQ